MKVIKSISSKMAEIQAIPFSALLLFLFYALGTLLLPTGSFSSLNSLPDMYHRCKATEDKDLTPLDFITDHLINIDGLFDSHDQGDEQKPHTPSVVHYQVSIIFTSPAPSFTLQEMVASDDKPFTHWRSLPLSDYHAEIFRPPLLQLHNHI
jgi:hypothetical protein